MALSKYEVSQQNLAKKAAEKKALTAKYQSIKDNPLNANKPKPNLVSIEGTPQDYSKLPQGYVIKDQAPKITQANQGQPQVTVGGTPQVSVNGTPTVGGKTVAPVSTTTVDPNLSNPNVDYMSIVPPQNKPTVATTGSPVMDKGAPTTNQTDYDTKVAIALKKAKGETLTDDEITFLIKDQMKKSEPIAMGTYDTTKYDYDPTTGKFKAGGQEVDVTEVFDTSTVGGAASAQKYLAQQQALEASNYAKSEEERLKGTREGQLLEQKKLLDADAARAIRQTQEAGARQQESVQSALSFSGFGRSTYNADKQAEISADTAERERLIQSAADAQYQAYKASLENADSQTVRELQMQATQMKNQAAQLELQTLGQIAELNIQNKVTADEALNNLIQGLGQANQAKVSKDVSELLGYMADEFGNAIGVGPDGQPIPIQGDKEAVKYSQVVDPYTGNIYFYDPADPTGTFMSAPVNGIKTYTDENGNVTSSPGSNASGMQDAKGLIPDELYNYGGNCVFFTKQYVPNMPSGADSKAGRLKGIQEAQKAGYGGTDLTQIQPGYGIHTTEGNVGHSAVVGQIQPSANGGFDLTLLESNYRKGQITYGRTLNTITDAASIIGWIKPTGEKIPSLPTDGDSYPIDTQINGKNPFTASQVQDFLRYDEKNTLPTFTGRSQAEKDKKAEQFKKDYGYFASLRDSGKIKLQDYAPEQYKELKTKAAKDPIVKNAPIQYYDVVQALRDYKDVVDKAGSVAWLENNQSSVTNALANLKTAWKESKNLGALTGPDLGLIEDAIPDITSWTSFFKKFLPGDATDQIKNAIDQQINQIQKSGQARLNVLKLTYPDLQGSDFFNEIESQLTGMGAQATQNSDIDFYNSL